MDASFPSSQSFEEDDVKILITQTLVASFYQSKKSSSSSLSKRDPKEAKTQLSRLSRRDRQSKLRDNHKCWSSR